MINFANAPSPTHRSVQLFRKHDRCSPLHFEDFDVCDVHRILDRYAVYLFLRRFSFTLWSLKLISPLFLWTFYGFSMILSRFSCACVYVPLSIAFIFEPLVLFNLRRRFWACRLLRVLDRSWCLCSCTVFRALLTVLVVPRAPHMDSWMTCTVFFNPLNRSTLATQYTGHILRGGPGGVIAMPSCSLGLSSF